MTTTELHALRSAQLKALCEIPVNQMRYSDALQLQNYYRLCHSVFDTSDLSDKALEEIQTLADRYLEQIA